MAPAVNDRPPDNELDTLKTSMIQAYKASQLFLSYTVRQQSRRNWILAAFKLDDVQAHISNISMSENQLRRSADSCEKHSNLLYRKNLRKLAELSTDFHQAVGEQFNRLLVYRKQVNELRLTLY
jgi:hypothetical protein